jgi:hypothetical protein
MACAYLPVTSLTQALRASRPRSQYERNAIALSEFFMQFALKSGGIQLTEVA